MSQPQIEPLGGGLVLSRDASLLEPGELSAATDIHVKPGSPSVHKVPGRTAFNTTGLTAPTGLAYCQFETADDKIAVADSGSYKVASAAALTGTFSSLAGDAGATLDTVVLDDRVVLLSGPSSANASNRVLLSDGTSRPHGLHPTTTAPPIIHTATGGTWALGANELGWFEYWTTEVYKVGEGAASNQDEIESTFAGTPATVNVTATTSYVTVRRPDVINAEASHWRVYRSERKENQSDQAFPIGWLIGEIPITQLEFNDGLATTVAGRAATTADTPLTELIETPRTLSIQAWGDTTYALADDANSAVSASVSYTPALTTISQLRLGAFGFTNITAPITGIVLSVKGSRTQYATLTAYLSWDGGVTWTKGRGVPLTLTQTTVTVDGQDWGRVWGGSEFSNANFKLLLIASGSDTDRGATTGTVSVNYVTVALTHNSTAAGLITQFPLVNLRISNESVPIGANGHPPPATTGDVFQSAMLTNDVNNPTEVSWTIPGTIDYSPIHYSAVVGDVVKCIRTLGSAAIIGCAGSKVRMNYLPVAEDPEFNTGRCIEVYDTDDGAVSHKAMCRFTLAGEPRVFGIGSNNLWMTNGYTSTSATDDIIWTDMVNSAHLSLCFVENNVKHHELLVHYPATGSTTVNKTLRLSYHTTHLKDGKLKVSGITNYGPLDATSGIHSSGERRVYTLKGTKVYVENQGHTDGSGGTIVPALSTREMHQSGHGSSWELLNVGIHHQGGGSTLSASLTGILANYPAESTAPVAVELTDRMLSIIDGAASGDGIMVNLTGEDDGNPLTIDYLVLFQEGLGETVPLKQ